MLPNLSHCFHELDVSPQPHPDTTESVAAPPRGRSPTAAAQYGRARRQRTTNYEAMKALEALLQKRPAPRPSSRSSTPSASGPDSPSSAFDLGPNLGPRRRGAGPPGPPGPLDPLGPPGSAPARQPGNAPPRMRTSSYPQGDPRVLTQAEQRAAQLGARLLRACAVQSVRRVLDASFYSTASNETSRAALRSSAFWGAVEFSVAAICVLVFAGRTPFDMFQLNDELTDLLQRVYRTLSTEFTGGRHVLSRDDFEKVVHAATLLVIRRYDWSDPCLEQLRAMPDLPVLAMHSIELALAQLGERFKFGARAPSLAWLRTLWGPDVQLAPPESAQPEAWQLSIFTARVVETSSSAFGPASQLTRARALGEGSFGKVYAAARRGDPDEQKPLARDGFPLHNNLAVKVSTSVGVVLDPGNYREIVLWQLVTASTGFGSRCVTKLAEVHVQFSAERLTTDLGGATFETALPETRSLSFVTERGLEFRKMLTQCAQYDAEEMKPWRAAFAVQAAANLLAGLVFLNKLKLVHGDLKGQNCIFDFRSSRLQISDWGSARPWEPPLTLQPLDAYDVSSTNSQTTLWYAAPETLLGEVGPQFLTSSAIDVWAAGCMLYELFSRGSPYLFQGDSEIGQLMQIMSIRGEPALGSIVRQSTLWQDNASNWFKPRPQALLSPVFCGARLDQFREVLVAALAVDMEARPSAAELLRLPLFEDVDPEGAIAAPDVDRDPEHVGYWRDLRPLS